MLSTNLPVYANALYKWGYTAVNAAMKKKLRDVDYFFLDQRKINTHGFEFFSAFERYTIQSVIAIDLLYPLTCNKMFAQ